MLSSRQLFFENLAQTSFSPIAIEIASASGCWLYSSDGKSYFDLIAGVSVSNIGHNNPDVAEAVKAQISKHMHLMVYGEFVQNPQVRLAELVTQSLPANLKSVFYTNSGSESVEGAIKLSRRYTGRYEVISFKNAYHGSTTGALSVMGNEKMKNSFRPLMPSVSFVEYNRQSDLDKISCDTACVIVEPVQGEAGVILPADGFLKKLRDKCNDTGSLLIFDEVQTGFGRTGKMFAMDLYEVVPDIVLFAKGFGGGMPLGAFISSKEIMSSLCEDPALGHITTFGGHPVSCAAGLASLKFILEKKLYLNALDQGKRFKQLLNHSLIKNVRGEGLLISVELETAEIARNIISIALKKGLVTDWFLFNDKCIRISPPLIISGEETEYACRILQESMDDL